MGLKLFMEPNFSIFQGGWSYSPEEIKSIYFLLPKQKNLNVLEFGAGDSSIKLYNLLSKVYEVNYDVYESNSNYEVKHHNIKCFIYNENDILNLDIGNKKYDLILIDGPTGISRKYWYSKITNNIKNGSIILIDDWDHYQEFEDYLVNDFGSKIKYDIIESHNDPIKTENTKSYKIIKVI